MQRYFVDEDGFSLIEAVVALGILATSLLSLAAIFALGLRHVASSGPNLIAREKARETVENVHTARDTRILRWADINNVSAGGVFLNGPQPMRRAGTDGLVNTADDDTQIEEVVAPGADQMLGTEDDIRTPLSTFTREIEISELKDANGQVIPTLRQLRVTVTYRLGADTRRYVLTTYISAIS